MKLLIVIFFVFISFLSLSIQADELTHQLGNSGYAIREAMQAKAYDKSPGHYWKSVYLQRQARIMLQKRKLELAMQLSVEAQREAKMALEQSQ